MDKQLTDQNFTAIIALIFYLEQEAGSSGIEQLQAILRRTLREINMLISSGSSNSTPNYGRIIDCNFYRILNIINKFSDIKQFDLQELLLILADPK